jgi:glycerophosphoryl diester phosphodiesterase
MGRTGRPRVVGHRGAPLAAPENTLASIEAAARLGADGVEVDVRVAGDGVVVVIHDDDVSRTTTGRGRVADLDAASLSTLGIPRLDEVVARVTELHLWIDIEVKEPAAAIIEALASLRLPAGGLVSSFVPEALDLVAARAPHLGRALLTLPGWGPEEALAAARPHGGWAPHLTTLRDAAAWVAAAHQAGLAVHVWTVDDPEDVREMAAAGVDSVITNAPDRARDVLER